MPDAEPKLMPQEEARETAHRINAEKRPGELIAIAVPYPFNCWGGTEKGWTVVRVDPTRF